MTKPLPESKRITPAQRSQVARIGQRERTALYDGREVTKKATAASPASVAYWEAQVDPAGLLDPAQRRRRAEAKRSAHFRRLALASSRARRGRAARKVGQ